MVREPRPRLVSSDSYPGASIGLGVIFWGKVELGKGCHIGNNVVVGTPYIDHGNEPIRATRLGSNVWIGDNAVIHNGVVLNDDVKVDDHGFVGDCSQIGEGTEILYGARLYLKVFVGRGSKIAGFCCDRSIVQDSCIMMGKLIHDAKNPLCSWADTEEASPIIKERAFVGFDALVIGGVTVNSGSRVLAGAIVTKDVAADTIVVGTTHIPIKVWHEMIDPGQRNSPGNPSTKRSRRR